MRMHKPTEADDLLADHVLGYLRQTLDLRLRFSPKDLQRKAYVDASYAMSMLIVAVIMVLSSSSDEPPLHFMSNLLRSRLSFVLLLKLKSSPRMIFCL